MTRGSGAGWLVRLVISFACLQGAVSAARPAVSYHALALGADARAVGVVAAVYALLPVLVAVPLGRHTDRGRCAPLLVLGILLTAAGCVLSATARGLGALAGWSAVMGLGHLAFVIGAQSLVARQSDPDEAGAHDRNFGIFTIGASLGQLAGPLLAGWLVDGEGTAEALWRSSAVALAVSGALALCGCLTLWRVERRARGRVSGNSSSSADPAREGRADRVPVSEIARARGVPAGIFTSLAVLSATDVLTAYLPVVGEERGIAPATVGVLLSVRAGASVLSRAALRPMVRLLGRQLLLAVSCLVGGALCVLLAAPVPTWAMALALLVLGFCLGVGQPLTMTTVVRAAPPGTGSTALALRLTGNRFGQVAAPAGAGLVAGVAGAAAPFVLLGVVLLAATGAAGRARPASGE